MSDNYENPKKGERWRNLISGNVCRVMANPIEGWVMARYKGAMPFLYGVSTWHHQFELEASAQKAESK